MLIGVVGAPNKGKSTFFSAATQVDAAIANYPFTTVTPSQAVTYVRSPCPHVALGLKSCNPKNSKCVGGVRLVPVGMIDVPGLVPEAHKGRGLGNRFLDAIRQADALIQVVDATGSTDLHGNAAVGCDPLVEISFLKQEMAFWVAEIMQRKRTRGSPLLAHDAAESLSGLRITEEMIRKAASRCGLEVGSGLPDDEGCVRIARELLEMRLPFAYAYNKMDLQSSKKNFDRASEKFGQQAFGVSAAIELALRKAHGHALINYVPGASDFEIVGQPDERQKDALGAMRLFLQQNNGTGVQNAIDWLVYQKLGAIVVYPVEDEHRFSNHKGEVLPDAFLVPKGTTALQLAARVHTDLAGKFIGAVDARRHVRVGADHALSDGDVIRIVSGR